MKHLGLWLSFAIVLGLLGCSAKHRNGGDAIDLDDFDNADSGAGFGNSPGSGSGNGSGTVDGGTSSSPGSGGSDSSGGGDGASDPGSPNGIVDGGLSDIPDALALCGGGACQCADGLDNDGDGVADGFDIECTGPADNDEGSFATGISGDNRDPKWQDCFFDGNSGAGDDGCRYHTECLTGERPADDPSCTVTQACIDFCIQRTPNGCDCFGCCTVQTESGPINVMIGTNCDGNDITKCDTCTPSPQCNNECGECELCAGRTVADLPDSCSTPPPPTTGGSGGTDGSSGSGGTTGGSGGTGGTGGCSGTDCGYVCEGGAELCASQADCPAGDYCSFGCCKLIPPI